MFNEQDKGFEKLMQIIEVRNVTKVYSGGTKANKDISFHVESGESVGILGPNGAGKSTLLREIYGELLPSSGYISLFSLKVPYELDSVKNMMGIIPQESTPRTDVTAFDHTYFLLRMRGFDKDSAIKRTRDALSRFGLWEHRRMIVLNLSGGMKRKLLLALALSHDPQLLILDEPTVGVDIATRREIWDYLRRFTESGEKTMILTSHYPEEIEELCKRVVIMNEGSVAFDGTLQELARYSSPSTNKESLEAAYLRIVGHERR